MSQLDFKMHPKMKLGPVSLRVKDPDLMLSFYEKELGLRMVRRDGDIIELGADEKATDPLLTLKHDSKAGTAPHDAAGLYHYALLLPERKSLAAAYLSLGNAGVIFDGFADHLVSEALYLTDPEGNGIEIYADRPRGEWKYDDEREVQMATQPLDVDSLLKELSSSPGERLTAIPENTRIGHIHLKVTEIRRSIDFYQNVLGLDLMSYWESAAFLSTAGYHHHVGMNTWESLMGSVFVDGHMGLEYFTLSIPDVDFVRKITSRLSQVTTVKRQDSNRFLVSDPDGIKFLITPST